MMNEGENLTTTADEKMWFVPWRKTIRRETGLIEHICEHGVGHPAYGSVVWLHLNLPPEAHGYDVHGCDGCCVDSNWQIADLRAGVEIANRLLVEAKNEITVLRDKLVDLMPTAESE